MIYQLDPSGFGIEFIYTIIMALFCFIIYFKTKEPYKLTRHKGIKYFRMAFVFLHLGMLSTTILDISLRLRTLHPFSMTLLAYFSTMAIFYLVYSTIWKHIKKKINETHFIAIANMVAIIFSIISFITRSHTTLFTIQIFLVILAIIAIFIKHKNGKMFSQIKFLYLLTFIFWIINLFILGPKCMVPFEFKLLLQLISIIIFSTINLKINKWVK